MSSSSPTFRSHLTLGLATLLHAFTHAYSAMLIPLYLMIRDDLHLPGVKMVALIVAAYGAVYFVLSYPAGILADRLNRKMLLGVGLVGNGLAIMAMALTHQYWLLLGLGVAGGIFGTLYHPAANALAPAHYPRSTGMALGILGIGSGIGFYFGSQYSGWRAQSAAGGWWGMSAWQRPCLEMGLAGVAMGVLFLLLAREVAHAAGGRPRVLMGKGMRRLMLGIALVSGCRDFAGVATMSLLSIYLQKAHHFDAERTGWILGAMGLISVAATPLAVWATSGQRRLPGLAGFMIGGGVVLAAIPHVPIAWLLPVLALFQVFHLGSYAISELSLVERVAPDVRGRAIGLYLTVAGTLGAVSPWVIGFWTDHLGERARQVSGYVIPFTAMALLMMVAASAIRLLARLGEGMGGERLRGVDFSSTDARGLKPTLRSA